MLPTQIDKAGKTFWDGKWEDGALLPPADPRNTRWGNYVVRQMHRFFADTINKLSPRPDRLLEVGCANSQWLPYFALQYGLDVWGVDYSEIGCAGSREIMRRAQLHPQQILHADLFQPPRFMEVMFDIVVSFGLVEHFQDTAGCIRACARFLRPGGSLITLIPNERGLTGFLQKHLDRVIFDKHVPLDLSQLVRAHEAAGLKVSRSAYICFFNFGVLDPGEFVTPSVRKFMMLWGHRFSMILGRLHEAGAPLWPNRITSSHIGCASIKA
jgi:SAM-dependent methyltransferase